MFKNHQKVIVSRTKLRNEKGVMKISWLVLLDLRPKVMLIWNFY